MCDFIFEHRERQRKKHFCLLRCLSAFATPIKLYFRCVFKLLPYVALALCLLSFYIRILQLLPLCRTSSYCDTWVAFVWLLRNYTATRAFTLLVCSLLNFFFFLYFRCFHHLRYLQPPCPGSITITVELVFLPVFFARAQTPLPR